MMQRTAVPVAENRDASGLRDGTASAALAIEELRVEGAATVLEQPTFMIVERVKTRRASPRRLARAAAAVDVAVRDFRVLGLSIGVVSVSGTGTYGGAAVVVVGVGSHEFIVGDGDHAQLVVNVVRLLKVVATGGNTQWPTVPGIGALDVIVRDGCAIWTTPDGAEFCEVGRIFPDDAAKETDGLA
ncbi:MAG: hypothetical protein ACQEW8_14705 [Actinomycetota bacterium]